MGVESFFYKQPGPFVEHGLQSHVCNFCRMARTAGVAHDSEYAAVDVFGQTLLGLVQLPDRLVNVQTFEFNKHGSVCLGDID